MKPNRKRINPIKVGDKVKIRSIDWYNSNKDAFGVVHCGYEFTKSMSEYCGEIATIKSCVGFNCYTIDIDNNYHKWTPRMFEKYD